MHKFNTYGTWEDNSEFWKNNLINSSVLKKLKRDYNKKYVHNGEPIKLQNKNSRFDKNNDRNSNKTKNTNEGSNKVIKDSKKKKNDPTTLLSRDDQSLYYK
jgi:hypothetical protein